MGDVVFIDSSVLLCLLDVPGKNESRDEVEIVFDSSLSAGDLMILPMATIVETGNHIAQLPNGHSRRQCGERLEAILQQSIEQTPPWVVGETKWDSTLVGELAGGVESTALLSLSRLAMDSSVGAGDASIVHEARRYKASVNVPSGQKIRVWSLDANLASIAESSI